MHHIACSVWEVEANIQTCKTVAAVIF